MADMTFKANLMPDPSGSYSIGSDENKWYVYGRNYGSISHNKDLVTKEYADAIIQVSNTEPEEENNVIWINDGLNGVIAEVPTIQEAFALGISSASIGQGIKINTIDGDGSPVTWAPANFIEVSCSSADAGKVLVVNSLGQLVLMTKSEWENSL